MSPVEKLWDLVERLNDASADSKIDWQPTASDNGFQVSFPRYAVMITQGQAGDGDTYKLEILDETGRVIEEANPDDVGMTHPTVSPDGAYRTLHNLFSLARFKALGVAEAVDSLMQSLDSIAPPRRAPNPVNDDDVPF